jgi:predicted DNA-binding protein
MLRFSMPRQYPEKLQRVHIGLPLEIHRKLRALATRTGYSIGTVVREILSVENIDKAAEVLRAEAKREDNQ